MINGGIRVEAKGLMKFWMRRRSQSGDLLNRYASQWCVRRRQKIEDFLVSILSDWAERHGQDHPKPRMPAWSVAGAAIL